MFTRDSQGENPAFLQMNQKGTTTMVRQTTKKMMKKAKNAGSILRIISTSGGFWSRKAAKCIQGTPELE
jgi:hypothetical protein